MKTHIFDRDNLLTTESRERLCRRLQFAFSRFEGLLRHIDVRINDENGPRGGVDKALRLTATLTQGETLVVCDFDEDVLAAASRAADRLVRSLVRQVDRRRNRRLEPHPRADG